MSRLVRNSLASAPIPVILVWQLTKIVRPDITEIGNVVAWIRVEGMYVSPCTTRSLEDGALAVPNKSQYPTDFGLSCEYDFAQ